MIGESVICDVFKLFSGLFNHLLNKAAAFKVATYVSMIFDYGVSGLLLVGQREQPQLKELKQNRL